MRSIQTGPCSPTEARLDYRHLVPGQLVIVVRGLSAAGRRREPAAASVNARSPCRSHSPLIEEAEAISDAIGYTAPLCTPLVLAAWRGQEALTLELVAAVRDEARAEYAVRATALGEYSKAVLYNGLGRYDDAVAAAQRACTHEHLSFIGWARLELIEAAARSHAHDAAAEALRHFEQRARTVGTDWARGVLARSAALFRTGSAAEALFHEAIERLGCDQTTVHLARAQLVYGEWLRRENRRVDARNQLRSAYDTFSGIAAEAFAERARRELLATGETARRRNDESRDILTPQEAQTARLAREGFSNAEIGAQLFISPRTVQYHLRKVFQKLGITSRNQLVRVAPGELEAA
jgi:DNA-binding CsgD family transcriptional regulator